MSYYEGVKAIGLLGSVGSSDVWIIAEMCGYSGFCCDMDASSSWHWINFIRS